MVTDQLPDVILDSPEPVAPVGDRRTIVLVHRDAQGDIVYWCGYTNGHDGQGWTAERREAMEFTSLSAANLERKVCRGMHSTMRVTLHCDDGGES